MCVFCNGIVGIVYSGSFFVEIDVFQDGIEFNGIVNLWFFFGGKIDGFCVVVIFEVKYGIVGLVVFIVID